MRPSNVRGALLVVACCGPLAAAVFACVGDPPVPTADQPDAAPPPVGASDALPPPTTPGEDAGHAADTGTAVDAGSAADAAPEAAADAGVDPAKTHCEKTLAPPGATDFLCADFDGPTLGPWDQVLRDDGGLLDKITTVAVSPPNALNARARSTGGGGGALVWKPVSAKSFIEATAHIQINAAVLGGVVPPSTGDVDLIDIRTQTTSVTFGITRGGASESSPYSGYFLKLAAFGGAAQLIPKNVNTPLSTNVWTDVKLIYAANGNVKLLYNDIVILNVTGHAATDSSVTFQIGAYATFTSSVPEPFRFDDAELSIRR